MRDHEPYKSVQTGNTQQVFDEHEAAIDRAIEHELANKNTLTYQAQQVHLAFAALGDAIWSEVKQREWALWMVLVLSTSVLLWVLFGTEMKP